MRLLGIGHEEHVRFPGYATDALVELDLAVQDPEWNFCWSVIGHVSKLLPPK